MTDRELTQKVIDITNELERNPTKNDVLLLEFFELIPAYPNYFISSKTTYIEPGFWTKTSDRIIFINANLSSCYSMIMADLDYIWYISSKLETFIKQNNISMDFIESLAMADIL